MDGVTAAEYEQDLEGNLQRLLDRAKSGTTVLRLCDVCIFRRVAQLPRLARSEFPLWRTRFSSGRLSCCWSRFTSRTSWTVPYGFRPGRSAHQALESFRGQLMKCRGGYVLEVDIRKFFDNLDHGHLRTFLQLRVRDGVLMRLIGKWLKAGVMEDGSVSYPDSGSPQGGVVSPLLSNVFLHYVLDLWFEHDVKPRMRDRAFLIRFADDFVIGFRDARDAQRVMEVIPKRFGKYGLTIHPTKSRLVPFRPSSPWANDDRGEPDEPAGTFDLLGFTHYWARSRNGYWVVKLKTATDRFTRAVRSIDSLVPRQSAPPDRPTASEAEREVARTLCVLRRDRELRSVDTVSPRGRGALAAVAKPPQ